MKKLDVINYVNCISASRPDRITPGTLWIRRSNDKNGVYPTTQIINGVVRFFINMNGLDIINYGNCIATLRPDRTIPGIHWIGFSNHKNGVYSTTHFLHGVPRISIEVKEFEYLIMEIVCQTHAPTALHPVLNG
jgi:hypothetical protein